jgi:hypothetical protein
MAGNGHFSSDKQDEVADMDLSVIDPRLLQGDAAEAVTDQASDPGTSTSAMARDATAAEGTATDEEVPNGEAVTPNPDDITVQGNTAEEASTSQPAPAAAPIVQATSAPQLASPPAGPPIFDQATQAQIDVLESRLPAPLPSAGPHRPRPWTQEEDDLLMFLSNMRVSHKVISTVGPKFIPCLSGSTSADCLPPLSTTSAESAGLTTPARHARPSSGRSNGRLRPAVTAAPEPMDGSDKHLKWKRHGSDRQLRWKRERRSREHGV